jgi:AAA15 family ATPase/GTPase
LIDPRIDRVAVSMAEAGPFAEGGGSKAGILRRLKGLDDRVPIGSMGDGVWRLFGLALAAVRSGGGVLLVDEIDTGLHYTVMRDMWRFLHQCAKKYDVQVVATTHSWDCCRALAAICREDVSEDSDVTFSRIEKDREEAVTYTEQEIIAVAEREIEVR